MDYLAQTPVTICFTKAGIAAGTTTTLTQTLAGGATSNIYAIKGKMYSAAALSNTPTPTTDWATGAVFKAILANQESVFLVGFDHAGTLRAIQGQVTALDTISVPGNPLTAPMFGATAPAGSGSTDADFCPIGYIVVACGATANNTTGWTFGSNNLSSVTGVTYTFIDVAGMPDRPQIS